MSITALAKNGKGLPVCDTRTRPLFLLFRLCIKIYMSAIQQHKGCFQLKKNHVPGFTLSAAGNLPRIVLHMEGRHENREHGFNKNSKITNCRTDTRGEALFRIRPRIPDKTPVY